MELDWCFYAISLRQVAQTPLPLKALTSSVDPQNVHVASSFLITMLSPSTAIVR